jgi:hypothetical protein
VTSRFKTIEIFEKSRFAIDLRGAIDSRSIVAVIDRVSFYIKLGEKVDERKKYRHIGRRALARQRHSGISWARVSILDNNPTRSRQSRERFKRIETVDGGRGERRRGGAGGKDWFYRYTRRAL